MLLPRFAALAVLATATTVHAEPVEDLLPRLAAAVHAGLDELIAARPPALVPPVPIKLTWKATRLGSLDLGAPLVAMTAGDADGDGKAELYAVTGRELIAIGLPNGKPKELARTPFVGEPAPQASRDVVGTALVAGAHVLATVSTRREGMRAGWSGKQLVRQAAVQGFTVCDGEQLALVPGRNYFGELASPLYGVRCRRDLVDAQGRPLAVRGALTGTTLAVTVETCAAGTCTPAGKHDYKDYGAAFELADLDRDGTPEVIVTGAGAPGDADAVKVFSLGRDDKKGLYRKTFNGGVVAVAVVDGSVVAAVRLLGATRVDLWRLN